ncbi:Nucleoporin Nup54/Nup57/Nup44 protein [Dioscorea alata]|uniref:Nucleoporin Nup54/Nup57/Nup44 protein n=1 Tax=Dioscorea alata TaxID=55571 RepID=A0ACB7V9F6_DIOAL|nr:Nucleoporin Nup54/Nup57/Nup44 protein [Dioscorea alata]
MFGTPSSTPAFGTPSSTPAFGTPSSTPAFGTPSSTPALVMPSTTPAFGAPSSAPAFGTPSTPAFGATPSPFAQPQQSPFTPFSNPQPQQQPNPSFGFQNPSPSPFPNAQVTTQMAPVAPLSLPLPDRDVQAIVDAYKDEPGNPKYSFRHLLFSVTDPAARVKPVGASDIMWAEAMAKLEGMEALDRERLWPQLVQGFKDLSDRLKLQDEVIVSDTERLRQTQVNVNKLQNHFVAETLPWIQRMRQKEQELQRRLLRMMRIVEALEGKRFRVPLTKAEVELAEKLATIARQLKGPGADLSKRVHNLLRISRLHGNAETGGPIYLPGSTKIDEQSLADMQDVLQKQTEAIARLGNVLKRDTRDMEIIVSEGADMVEDSVGRRALKT